MARKHKHEEHENHERWLVSYADFITLLFAFFVVMYAISSVNEGKYRVLSDSLTAAFRNAPHSMEPIQFGAGKPSSSPSEIPLPGSSALIALPVPVQSSPLNLPVPPSPRETEEALREHFTARPRSRDMGEIADRIVKAMSGLIRDDLINVRREKRWLEVEIKSSILFPSGSARLADAAYPMLQELAKILGPFPNPIHVEGFTDNLPIHTLQFPSNWELSAARAASVVHLFMEYGIEPGRMAAIGYGEHKPVGDNATPEGRAQNRRVVLVILSGEDPRWMDQLPQAEALLPDQVSEGAP